MSSFLDAVYARGEFVSLVVALVALWIAAPRVAALVGRPRAPIGSLYADSVIVFVVVGRIAYLVAESPETLLDPLVAIRIQGGIDPLWGAAATLAVLAWAARGEGAAAYWPLATAWAVGLALAVAVYDLSCPLRDACYGARAEPPLGFRMSGLADTRLATPALEGALLLALLGALVLTWRRWRTGSRPTPWWEASRSSGSAWRRSPPPAGTAGAPGRWRSPPSAPPPSRAPRGASCYPARRPHPAERGRRGRAQPGALMGCLGVVPTHLRDT